MSTLCGYVGGSCERLESLEAELARVREELYMARADKSQALMEAERAMEQIRKATARVVAERDAAVADSERLEWALPILTGADSDDADKLAMKLALALMRGLDGRAAIDFARKEC